MTNVVKDLSPAEAQDVLAEIETMEKLRAYALILEDLRAFRTRECRPLDDPDSSATRLPTETLRAMIGIKYGINHAIIATEHLREKCAKVLKRARSNENARQA